MQNGAKPRVPGIHVARLRLIAAVTSGATLVLGALLYIHFFLWLPEGSGPAGLAVPRSLFEAAWTSRPVELIGLGDSITTGFGASPGHSYFDRLVVNPPDEFAEMQGICLRIALPNLRFENISMNGSTSFDCLEDQLPKLRQRAADVFGAVVMTTGGNDIIHMYGRIPPREGAMYGATLEEARPWIANYEQRLDQIVAGIRQAFPGGCAIFIGSIYDPSDELGTPEAVGLPAWPEMLAVLREYNACIARCVTKHEYVHLVDIHAAFLGHGIGCRRFWLENFDRSDPHFWYFNNIEDPNDRGYDAIRRIFLLRMAEVLPARLGSSGA